MSVDLVGSKRRWAASAAGGLVVMVAVAFLLNVPAPPSPSLVVSRPGAPAKPLRAAVQLTRADGSNQKLADEAVIHDQIPLFLPTARNVAMKPPPRPEAGHAMLDQTVSRMSFDAEELRLKLPPPEEVPERVTDAMLNGAPPIPLLGFGQVETKLEPAKPHGGVLEVFSVGNNRRVLGPQVLGVDAKPPTERAWRPLEFLMRVNASGLAGPLTITVRSEVEEVDKFFRNYLGETFRIGDRLPPGSYRIIVGP